MDTTKARQTALGQKEEGVQHMVERVFNNQKYEWTFITFRTNGSKVFRFPHKYSLQSKTSVVYKRLISNIEIAQ